MVGELVAKNQAEENATIRLGLSERIVYSLDNLTYA